MFRALLVDDERLSLVSTRCSVRWAEWGFHDVAECSDPYEALRLLRTQRFDAAFVDIRMPGLSGLQLIEQVDPDRTAFIVLTGYSDFTYARQALKLQAFDYCLKPLQEEDISILMPKLTAHLRKRRLTQDPDVYRALVNTQAPPDFLFGLGLDPKSPHLTLICMHAARPDPLTASFQIDGGQAALLYRRDGVFWLMATDKNPYAQLQAQLKDRAHPLGAAICTLGRSIPSLKALTAHASALADEQRQKSTRTGRVEIHFFDACDAQSFNEEFLRLFEEVSCRYREELSLSELAERYHLNYAYCSTLFSQRTGMSFIRYINTLRLQKACELLEDKETPIGEISVLVGYHNYNHFVSMFKRAYHMTPTQYRETLGGGRK